MILHALTQHYENLAAEGKVSKQGWCKAKVSFLIVLSKDGEMKGIISLKEEHERGKKKVWLPQEIEVPQMVARSSGVSANFLCDNSKYILGIDKEGTNQRILDCFKAAREKHLMLLEDVHDEMAEAVKMFFRKWEPTQAAENLNLQEVWEELTEGGNLIFGLGMNYAQDDVEIRNMWNKRSSEKAGEKEGICLVTGEKSCISRIHGGIKGVPGAQPNGAALVSFNAQAFESYGKEQSYNAPVGEYATFAYTTALNYLLSQREYTFQLGDTMIVFWAETGEEKYQDVFSWSVEPTSDNQEMLKGIFDALKEKRGIDVDGIQLNPEQKFYILGLSSNVARLVVRFFYQNSFGNILVNLNKHYQRMKIVQPSWVKQEYMGIGQMLQETVNQNAKEKKPIPNMASMVLQSILSGGNYPASLYSNTLIRIRAEQGRITWGKAAIVKAYLIKNYKLEKGDELMGLNEDSDNRAYVLGRIFAVLEAIQEEANPGINATIRDRYFNSACATPASIFPVLLKLKNSHIKKIDNEKRGRKIYYEQQLTSLIGKIEKCPSRLSLEEQGEFILGYYHQVQKRFEKKEAK